MLKSFEVNNSNTIPAPGNSELKMTESEKSVENLGPDYDKKLTGDFEKEDFLQWRDGAADFKNFSRQTKGQKIDDLGNYAKAEMQAMFLGEKPTTFCNDFARKNKELFEKFGFKF